MNEITNQNFNKVYPRLANTLKNANFIAIDGEFTGIVADDVKNRLGSTFWCIWLTCISSVSLWISVVIYSLFDSSKDRYEKQRTIIQPYAVIQFGITAFQHVPDKNEYTAEMFNFLLLPRSTPTKTRRFIWEIGALEFLAAYEFDFNKVYRILW